MADTVVGAIVRIPWVDLPLYGGWSSVPDGAHVVIDLTGIDMLPDKLAARDRHEVRGRDKYDFLNYQDREALSAIASAASRIDVDGEGHNTARIAAMVTWLRTEIARQEAERDAA